MKCNTVVKNKEATPHELIGRLKDIRLRFDTSTEPCVSQHEGEVGGDGERL